MKEATDNKRSVKYKIYDKYRLVILDEDTLGEIKSTRFSIFGVIVILIFSILLIGLFTFAIISFTPLKYTVPGYAEIENNKVYMDLIERLEEMEEQLDAQRIYTNGLKNVLNPSHQELSVVSGENGGEPGNKNEFTSIDFTSFYCSVKR